MSSRRCRSVEELVALIEAAADESGGAIEAPADPLRILEDGMRYVDELLTRLVSSLEIFVCLERRDTHAQEFTWIEQLFGKRATRLWLAAIPILHVDGQAG